MVGPTLRSVHGGGVGADAAGGHTDIPAGQRSDLRSYRSPCSSHLPLKAEMKSGLFYFVCLVFLGLFFDFFILCFCCFLFCFFWFSIAWNVWKLFNLNVGGREGTGKALFLHKTSIPNSANESVNLLKWWEVIRLLEFRFSFYGLTHPHPPALTRAVTVVRTLPGGVHLLCSAKGFYSSAKSDFSMRQWGKVQLGFVRDFYLQQQLIWTTVFQKEPLSSKIVHLNLGHPFPSPESATTLYSKSLRLGLKMSYIQWGCIRSTIWSSDKTCIARWNSISLVWCWQSSGRLESEPQDSNHYSSSIRMSLPRGNRCINESGVWIPTPAN